MKVLFLDIDGVVNCAKTTQRHRGVIGIDPYMAFIVGKLVDNVGCKVVLSSSWKNWAEGIAEIEKQVVKLHDKTPYLHYSEACRGDEIKAWLDKHPEVEKYAILDDDSDMLKEQLPNFFQTSWNTGITEEIAAKVTQHLTS